MDFARLLRRNRQPDAAPPVVEETDSATPRLPGDNVTYLFEGQPLPP